MRARQLGITKFEACFCMLIISICGDAAKVVGLSVQKMTITVPLASFENIEGIFNPSLQNYEVGCSSQSLKMKMRCTNRSSCQTCSPYFLNGRGQTQSCSPLPCILIFIKNVQNNNGGALTFMRIKNWKATFIWTIL